MEKIVVGAYLVFVVWSLFAVVKYMRKGKEHVRFIKEEGDRLQSYEDVKFMPANLMPTPESVETYDLSEVKTLTDLKQVELKGEHEQSETTAEFGNQPGEYTERSDQSV